MKFLNLFCCMVFLVALAMARSTEPAKAKVEDLVNATAEEEVYDTSLEPTSLRKANHFLSYGPRTVLTCDKYPRVCRRKSSGGPDCCKKKCVNVDSDRLNCGMCGKKCKFSEICCKGECVNPKSNRRHCGGCGNKCKRGSLCVYGMCSYA